MLTRAAAATAVNIKKIEIESIITFRIENSTFDRIFTLHKKNVSHK